MMTGWRLNVRQAETVLSLNNLLRALFGCFTGLPWVWGFPRGFPWVWVWDGYGDYDESPVVCGDSMGIFEWIPNYVETS